MLTTLQPPLLGEKGWDNANNSSTTSPQGEGGGIRLTGHDQNGFSRLRRWDKANNSWGEVGGIRQTTLELPLLEAKEMN